MSLPVPPAVAAATEPLLDRIRPYPPTGADEAAADAGKLSPAHALRFIDLCFEAAAIARDTFPPSLDGTPNPHFAAAYKFHRALMMRAEGLPASLLGDGMTANERHMRRMAREHPTGNWPSWARSQPPEGEQ